MRLFTDTGKMNEIFLQRSTHKMEVMCTFLDVSKTETFNNMKLKVKLQGFSLL